MSIIKNILRAVLPVSAVLIIAALSMLLISCPEETPPPGDASYTCDNGTPIDGTPTGDVTVGCQTCQTGFLPAGGALGTPGTTCAEGLPYVCTNGTAIDGLTLTPDSVGCQTCMDGFVPMGGDLGLPGTSCAMTYPHVCAGGTPISERTTTQNSVGCQTCENGFLPAGGDLGQPGTSCAMAQAYTCPNGMAITGFTGEQNTVGCQACMNGFVPVGTLGQVGTSCVTGHSYVCTNGMPISGLVATQNTVGCQTCMNGFIAEGTLGQVGTSCVMGYSYLCTNGMPISGLVATQNTVGCQTCMNGFIAEGGDLGETGTSCVMGYSHVCTNGMPISKLIATQNTVGCQTCMNGFIAEGGDLGETGTSCVMGYSYLCTNGMPISGLIATQNTVGCQTCMNGFVPHGTLGQAGTSCEGDSDNDSVVDIVDVDDDNDGLIEVSTLLELHNMRYNLRGTSYNTSSSDTGSSAGGPTAATTDCTTATGGVYLCGYELTQNLTFDADGSGSSWSTATALPDIVIDTEDVAAPYFTADEGWEPIGTSSFPFNAIFEGNGNTIAHMTVNRDDVGDIGLFGSVRGIIRNIGVTDVLVQFSDAPSTFFKHSGGLAGQLGFGGTISASYSTGTVSGSSELDYVGGLVGRVERTSVVTASYSTATITDGGGRNNVIGGLAGIVSGNVYASHATGTVRSDSISSTVGGLAGSLDRGRIIASYATGNVTVGSTNNDSEIGGLVGRVTNGNPTIIASFARGTVTGSSGSSEFVGGLVGLHDDGNIYTSYATGAATGGAGDADRVGGLIGEQVASTATGSYASGNVNGGPGDSDVVGSVRGALQTGRTSTITNSFGFGTLTGGVSIGSVSTQPPGITSAANFTENYAGQCSDPIYGSRAACESSATGLTVSRGVWSSSSMECSAPTNGGSEVFYSMFDTEAECNAPVRKTPGVWDNTPPRVCNAPATGATPGIDYSLYINSSRCQSTSAKFPYTWTATWNSADRNSLNAWIFTANTAPKLRFADYDGSGSNNITCDLFPAMIPNTGGVGDPIAVTCGASGTEIPGQ